MSESRTLIIRPANENDAAAILAMIGELADFENLRHEVTATEEKVRETLFGERPVAEALVGCMDGTVEAFAVYFHTYSTFLAEPGLYLEDLFVRPAFRGLGLGKALIAAVAKVAVERRCGRYEWSVLDWNANAIRFYEGLGAEMHADWRRMRVMGEALRGMAALATP